MATVAGYRAALLGATYLSRFFPLLMTAGGTVTPAGVLVLGAGVAGLAGHRHRARRLGAVVQAFDTRPLVREQVESPRHVPDPAARSGRTPRTGAAMRAAWPKRPMPPNSDLLLEPVRQADVIITTAAMARARRLLLSAEMVTEHAPRLGDRGTLSAATGGNCAPHCAKRARRVAGGVINIEGPTNLPASMPVHASQLFARNAGRVCHAPAGPRPAARGHAGSAVSTLTWKTRSCREPASAHAGRLLHCSHSCAYGRRRKEQWLSMSNVLAVQDLGSR